MLLTLNAGSSSLKFAVFTRDGTMITRVAGGQISGMPDHPVLSLDKAPGMHGADDTTSIVPGFEAALDFLLAWLDEAIGLHHLLAVGHRVVHGGTEFQTTTVLTTDIIAGLERCIPLAPLHEPHNLRPIVQIMVRMPELPQIACFDTAFHRTQPRLSTLYALPRAYTDQGLIRYGFHGLSYAYIASRLPDVMPSLADGRVIVAHLGNGASLCAMHRRHSVATSMGFSALDGLVMGTRCGRLDPGILLYLLKDRQMSADEISDLLYRQSGLLGVSGLSHDMKVLEASDRLEAEEAIALFCQRAAMEIASLTVPLGGLDALVFTAGIGEHSALIRQRICASLPHLGLSIDEDANQRNATLISADDSRITIAIIPTNEERMIATDCYRLLETIQA